jgi:hypothetical protein
MDNMGGIIVMYCRTQNCCPKQKPNAEKNYMGSPAFPKSQLPIFQKIQKILLEISVKSPSIQNLGFNLFLTNSYKAKPVPTTRCEKKWCFINMLCSNEDQMKWSSKSTYCINATNRLRVMQ